MVKCWWHGRCEAEASGWRGRDPHISLVPRCANLLWANLTKRCIRYTLTHTDTHWHTHAHSISIYIYTQMYYICTIYNELYAYISYILAQSMLHDIHWTWWLPPCDANAMRMPCDANAGAESLWRGSFRWTAAAGPKCFGRRRTSQFRRSESRCQRCSLDLGKLDKMR